jgi:hypothetical protein
MLRLAAIFSTTHIMIQYSRVLLLSKKSAKGLYTVYISAGAQSTAAMLGLARTRGVGRDVGTPRALDSEEEQTRSEVDPCRRFPLALRVPPLWATARQIYSSIHLQS